MKCSKYFVHNEFIAVLSSNEGESRTYAGAGPIISKRIRQSVSGFLQLSDHLASVRLRIPGGELCSVTVYAPMNVYPFDERQASYYEAQDLILTQCVLGPTLALGHFTATIHVQTPSDNDVVGEYVFGIPN